MNTIRLIKRLLFFPLGMFKSAFKGALNNARDFENKYRFRDSVIDSGCAFTPGTTLGKNCRIMENTQINFSNLGSYTYVARNAFIQHATIGNYCSIAHEVNIGLGAHPLNRFSTAPVFYRRVNPLKLPLIQKDADFEEYKQITIGSDVWIGARALIMDGVNIGHGAVVAAGSVVTKDVPAYAIVAGVPAKFIRYRFEESEREALLKSEWWLSDVYKVNSEQENLMRLCNPEAI